MSRFGRFVVGQRWLMVFLWVAVAVGLNLLVPQLERVIGMSASPIVPDSAPSMRALTEMDKRFGDTGTRGVIFVVLSDDKGLSDTDRRYYADLVQRLRANHAQVTSVQDTISQPELADSLASRDGKSLYIPVGVPGANGSPEANDQIEFVRTATSLGRPAGLDVHTTGPMATIADMQSEVDRSVIGITAVTMVLITIILLIIYRSVFTSLIALMTIGVALVSARAVTAFLGLHVFEVSTFTASFLTGVVLGAGTDYSVFLISRFHEQRRAGDKPLDAAVTATRRVAGVITASAATVIAADACMALAQVGIFTTTGPAIAVSVAVTLATALTLSPALLAIAASKGLVEPRRKSESRLWKGIGERVVRRPAPILLAGVLLLGALAAFYPALNPSFDERSVQPDSTDSNLGYTALAKHFPTNEVLPDYLLVESDHDLRNAPDLATLETVAAGVRKVEGVSMVRGVTRPLGAPIAEASVGYQAGEVGKKLAEAKEKLAQGQTAQLTDGTKQLAGGAGQLADGAKRAVDGASQLLDGMSAEQNGLGSAIDGAGKAHDGAAQLAAGANTLANALQLAHDQSKVAVDGLNLAYTALQRDLLCSLDPVCSQVRKGLGEIYAGERDQLLPGLAQAAAAARQIAAGNGDLATGLADMRTGLGTAKDGIVRLAEGQKLLKDKLGQLADGSKTMADGASRLSDGTSTMAGSVQQLQDGLKEAADFLLTTGTEAKDPSIGGFYLPARALADPKLALASGFFLSSDGKTARLIVLGESDPFGRPAMQRGTAEERAAVTALRGTPLAASQVLATGMAPTNVDLDKLSSNDFRLVALIALVAVFAILVLLLRSFLAPVYLLASVVLSYAAAMGIGVLVWQELLHQQLDWSVPSIAFILLVAVGADYNMLLMTRIRDESPDGSREGVARAVSATGGVITSAGIIFAASMFAMMSGSVTTLAQMGFTIGVGLLLDTFVVRTLVVPATAALLGRWNWWPSVRG